MLLSCLANTCRLIATPLSPDCHSVSPLIGRAQGKKLVMTRAGTVSWRPDSWFQRLAACGRFQARASLGHHRFCSCKTGPKQRWCHGPLARSSRKTLSYFNGARAKNMKKLHAGLFSVAVSNCCWRLGCCFVAIFAPKMPRTYCFSEKGARSSFALSCRALANRKGKDPSESSKK